MVGYWFGFLVLVYNGNLVNYLFLRVRLEENGFIFNMLLDMEVG